MQREHLSALGNQIKTRDKNTLIEKAFQKYIDLWLKGTAPSPKSFAADYPHIKKELEKKLKGFQFVQKGLGQEVWQGKKLGDFEIIKELGRGGMGVVFLANQTSLGRQAALKVLPANITTEPKAIKQFYKEAKIIAKFNHPHIVPIYSVGSDQDTHFIAMGYVKGLPLNRFIDLLQNNNQIVDNKKLGINSPVDQSSINSKEYIGFIAQTALKIAQALNYANQNGVCHRDLKPSNILLTKDGQPMLVDFGLAKDIEKESMTFSGFAGTFSYAAPEQIKGLEAGFKSDIWAFGLTLFELLTLKNPFLGKNISETSRNILELEPTPPRKINKAISKDLQTIIMKCLEKEPDKRYSTQELINDLKNYLQLKPIKARPISKVVKIRRRFSISKAAIAMLISLFVFLVLAMYFGAKNSTISKSNFISFFKTYSFTGTIKDDVVGKPIVNATVLFNGKKVKINHKGIFRLNGLRAGRYKLVARGSMLKTFNKYIVVKNKTVKLGIKMSPISIRRVNIDKFFPKVSPSESRQIVYSDFNGDGVEEAVIGYKITDSFTLGGFPFLYLSILGWNGEKYEKKWDSQKMNLFEGDTAIAYRLEVLDVNGDQASEVVVFFDQNEGLTIFAYIKQDEKYKKVAESLFNQSVELKNIDKDSELEILSAYIEPIEQGVGMQTKQIYKWDKKNQTYKLLKQGKKKIEFYYE